jgi:superfamily II RNA helicase
MARSSFLHYSSPCFRREGRQDLERITNGFSALYSKLAAAGRQDAQELHGKLVTLRKEMEEKERLLGEKEAALERYRLEVGELH